MTDITPENVVGMREDAMTEHPYITMRVEEMAKQIAEIHGFVSNLSTAMNNPMLKAMLPPQYRGMLGG